MRRQLRLEEKDCIFSGLFDSFLQYQTCCGKNGDAMLLEVHSHYSASCPTPSLLQIGRKHCPLVRALSFHVPVKMKQGAGVFVEIHLLLS